MDEQWISMDVKGVGMAWYAQLSLIFWKGQSNTTKESGLRGSGFKLNTSGIWHSEYGFWVRCDCAPYRFSIIFIIITIISSLITTVIIIFGLNLDSIYFMI
jgi:hypothetical protein